MEGFDACHCAPFRPTVFEPSVTPDCFSRGDFVRTVSKRRGDFRPSSSLPGIFLQTKDEFLAVLLVVLKRYLEDPNPRGLFGGDLGDDFGENSSFATTPDPARGDLGFFSPPEMPRLPKNPSSSSVMPRARRTCASSSSLTLFFSEGGGGM